METEESKELTLAQEETIKKTLEEIRKQDPKKNKRVYPIVVFGDEYDDKDVYIAYFREPDFIAFSKFVQLQKKDEIAAVRSLAHDTFIQGDKELVDDDSLFLYGQGRKFLDRWQVRDDEWLRQHIALVRHYFPSVELSTISDEDFALIANDALWLHKQVLTTSSVRLFS